MTFWSGEKLLANQHVVADFDANRIDVNSYTLRMGASYFVTADQEGAQKTKQRLAAGQAFIIPPGQFGYLITKEKVNVPNNAMAFISMRTKYKFEGLINVSGFHVDPGYKGNLVFAVFNAGSMPVHIGESDDVFKIWFADTSHDSAKPYIYPKSGLDDISNDMTARMGKEILSLQSLGDKLREHEIATDARLAEQKVLVENMHFVWRALTIAGIVALFTWGGGVIWRAGERTSNVGFDAVLSKPGTKDR
jgi:dCTP deaminase